MLAQRSKNQKRAQTSFPLSRQKETAKERERERERLSREKREKREEEFLSFVSFFLKVDV